MLFRIGTGIFAAALLLIYIAPVTLRLQDVALWAVVGIGCVMMLVDLWQSLKRSD